MSKNNAYRVAVITASDKGSRGERVDTSGPTICEMCEEIGYQIVEQIILPDEAELLANKMQQICADNTADLILTTGGTGFSPRDCMPEATLKVIERAVPGIPEAMRAESMKITPKAMLSRGIAGICQKTLIINLPGSKKSVKENLAVVLPALNHGLDILTGNSSDCGH